MLEPAQPPGIPRLFHTGVVVDDLEAAMAAFTAAFGCRWDAINHYEIEIELPDGLELHEWRSAYVLDGPHFIEFSEQIRGRFFTDAGPGIPRSNHLGVWVDDLDAEVARLRGLGFQLLMRAPAGAGVQPLVAFMGVPGGGMAVELVHVRAKASARWARRARAVV
jgi:catechol 2,3-dioxygenase-like lactoylglutathione lyase family enzyme